MSHEKPLTAFKKKKRSPSTNVNLAAQSEACTVFRWSNSENVGFESDSGYSVFHIYVFLSC